MKKLSALVATLMVLSMALLAIAPLSLAAEGAPLPPPAAPQLDDAAISWTPSQVVIMVSPGETEHTRVTFTSREAIARASLVASFPLNRYVRVEPHDPFQVVPGAIYPVDIAVTLPQNSTSPLPFWIMGTIQVVGEGHTYRSPLVVTIVRTNNRPPIHWQPSAVRLGVDAPDITNVPLSSTATVSFTTSVTLTNVRLRATPPLNRVLDLSQTGPMTLTPGVTYTLSLTAHHPLATSVTDPRGAPEAETDGVVESTDELTGWWLIYSGMVQVSDAHRNYLQDLPVTVVLGRQRTQPLITWRPPLVNFRLTPGADATQVVTMTSNMTIENATLKVTGPITPYLSVTPNTPFTILPNRPYPVTLVMDSPTTATLNRPLHGEVGVYDATGRHYRFDLKVLAMWHRPPSTPTPTPTTTP